MNPVRVQISPNRAGNGMVSLYAVFRRQINLNMNRGNHPDVGELPDVEFMNIIDAVDLL